MIFYLNEKRVRIGLRLRKLGVFIIMFSYRLNWKMIMGLQIFFNILKSDLGTRLTESFTSLNENRKTKISHQSQNGKEFDFQFYIPNYICSYRIDTFSTKEPETLKWIDEFGGEGIFFDIGANIGLYSIYYAATKSQPVYAFEPSFFNTKQLSKNIELNKLSNLINIVSTPLSEGNGMATFILSSTAEGGALSSFGVEYGQDGKNLVESLSYKTLGFSLDTLTKLGLVPSNPSLVKIDVDGIEDLILRGGMDTLSSSECKSILVEVSPSFSKQYLGVQRTLSDLGFKVIPSKTKDSRESYNQIWLKK
jgi:FkbM family methyltransferase